jgi:hypothetical protein
VVRETIVVCLGGFEENMLRVDDGIVADIHYCKVVFVKNFASVLRANVCFCLVEHVVGEKS